MTSIGTSRQLSVVLDRELSVAFDRPLSFLQNRASIILNRHISFFGFIYFENAKKGRIKQAYLEIYEKFSFFVEKNIDFAINREFSDFEKHRFSLKSGNSKIPLHLPFPNLSKLVYRLCHVSEICQ